MVVAAFMFSTMGVCIKYASAYFHTGEIIFYRGLVSVVLLWLLARKRQITFGTRYPMMHAWRSFVGTCAMGMWFYTVSKLPLATGMTLNYMSSLWIGLFVVGSVLLQWRPRPEQPLPDLQIPLVLTLLIGFAGVVLLLRPSINHEQLFAGLLGLLSGMLSALAYMQVVALSRLGEPEERVVFYFAVGSVVAGAIAMGFLGVSPFPGWPALWLIPVGLFATAGQLCMTKAYASATTRRATLTVATLQYSGIVFASFYSLAIFNDQIPLIGWLGMALIVGSGIAATTLRR